MLFSYLLYVFFFAISFLATKTFTSKMKFSTLWSSLNGKFTHARETHTRENETIFRANFSTLMKILQRLNDRLHVKLRKSIPNDEVEFMNYVGKGSSAQVYMARYRDSVVAVKVRLDEERIDELATQSQAAKTTHACTFVQGAPPPQPVRRNAHPLNLTLFAIRFTRRRNFLIQRRP